jgi:hypothetical protein
MDNFSNPRVLQQSTILTSAGQIAIFTMNVHHQHLHLRRLHRNVTRNANGLHCPTVAKRGKPNRSLTAMLAARFHYQLAKVQLDFATVMGIRSSHLLLKVMTCLLTAHRPMLYKTLIVFAKRI